MGNKSTTPDDINTRTRRAVMDERKKKANRLDNNTFILNPNHPVKEGRKGELLVSQKAKNDVKS